MTSCMIGSLRHRVAIERPERTSEDGGTASIAWVPVATVFASIEAATGRETVLADTLAGRLTHKVLIRWRADVAPPMRFVLNGRNLDIRAALDSDGRRRWLQCLCEEQLP